MNELSIKKPYDKAKGKGIKCGKSLTEQAHKKECDMNHILRQYQATGMVRHAKEHEGKYDDVTSQDFQSAMFIVTEAQQMFDSLPANMRKRFANSPAEFMDFVHNPANKEEMLKMGVLVGNDGIDVSGAVTTAPVDTQTAPEKVAEPSPPA